MKEELRQLLASRPRVAGSTNGTIPAAVLIPMFSCEGQYHILFTRRTEALLKHSGQVAFPGGAFEVGDGSLLNTALRESYEEIGLPPSSIEILGALDDTPTSSSGYLIYPFVGLIPWPFEFKLAPYETAEVFSVPSAALLDKNCCREEIRLREGKPQSVYYYQYQDRIIWGATARILKQFLAVFGEAEKQASPVLPPSPLSG
ncbi:MAG: CoA pyrophosphatase [Chloroflexota bacterium]